MNHQDSQSQDLQIDINGFLQRQRSRDSRQFALLGFFSLMLLGSLVVAFMAWQASTPGIASLLPALALTLLSTALILRQWRMMLATSKRYRDMSLPTHAMLDSLLAAVDQRIREYRLLMAGVAFALLPVFAIAALQLMAQGKMSGGDVASFMGLVIISTLAVLTVLRHRIRNQLEPQLRQLDELRQQL